MARRGDLTIRRLRPSDTEQLTALLRDAFAEEFEGGGTEPAAVDRQVRAAGWSQQPGVRHALKALGTRFAYFVAVYRGRVVGCAAVGGSRLSVISSIAVHPAFRRAGLGRALVERAERYAQEQHRDRVSLDVLAHNDAALTLYRSLGYEEYHCYRVYERAPILTALVSSAPPEVWLEPPTATRVTAFSAVERAALPARYFEVAPSLRERYLRPRAVQMLERLAAGLRSHRRAVVRDGRTVGFMLATTMPGHAEGRIDYPLIRPDAEETLTPALVDALHALHQSGKDSVRLDLSESRPEQHAVAESLGFRHRWTFLQMVHWLTPIVPNPIRALDRDAPLEDSAAGGVFRAEVQPPTA